MVFCDYIASLCQKVIDTDMSFDAGKVQLDLHPEHGYFISTKKTFDVTDMSGRKYTVTVEEAA